MKPKPAKNAVVVVAADVATNLRQVISTAAPHHGVLPFLYAFGGRYHRIS